LLDVTNLLVAGLTARHSRYCYLAGSGGASVIHGHTVIVFTLLPLFRTTVIFISFSRSD
jgi:hypothetical protein